LQVTMMKIVTRKIATRKIVTRSFLAVIVACAAGCSQPAPESTAPAETSAAAPAPAPVLPPVLLPLTTGVPVAKVTQSSMLETFDASGVLSASQPGWHAAKGPAYPQWVALTFAEPRTISRLSLLPQDTQVARAPKSVDVQTSQDGKTWTTVQSITDACQGDENSWREFAVDKPVTTSRLRLLVLANCGDPDYLTLRGVKVE
jgi:hypothetical protein